MMSDLSRDVILAELEATAVSRANWLQARGELKGSLEFLNSQVDELENSLKAIKNVVELNSSTNDSYLALLEEIDAFLEDVERMRAASQDIEAQWIDGTAGM